MVTMELAEKFSQETGVDVRPKGFVPDDEEELDLLMELKERPKIEMALGNMDAYQFFEERAFDKQVVKNALSSITNKGGLYNGVDFMKLGSLFPTGGGLSNAVKPPTVPTANKAVGTAECLADGFTRTSRSRTTASATVRP